MTFTQTLMTSLRDMFPSALIFLLVPLIPFIIAERMWPVAEEPRFRDYNTNVLIGLSTAYLSLPLGIIAGLWSAQLRQYLPWQPLSLTFDRIGAIPTVGTTLETLAMIFVPLLIHDTWYYWSHRLEHRFSFLWAFHSIHHCDERMNSSTWARDHFLQNSWRSFFSIFTLGLIVDLDLTRAGKAALYSNLFLMTLSMFYHSAIRVRLPWLDRILVTPQVHRIHHGIDPRYHNKNFADALPVFDILFGTYCRPTGDEFPRTGLGADFPTPRSFWSAQWHPLAAIARALVSRRQISR